MGFGLCWGPDGRSLFVNGTDNAKREGLFRLDAQTGEASLILEHRFGYYLPGLELSPDGRKIFYTALDEPGMSGYRVIARDLQSGQEQLLTRPRATLMALALSPDGEQLAFLGADGKVGSEGIFVMPSSGGAPRKLVRTAQLRAIAWSPDGRYLIYPALTKMPGPHLGRSQWELRRVSAQGGEPQRLDLSVDGLLRFLRVHPDGQRIVYYAWRGVKEVWVMENFLPGPEAAGKQ
jgi:Tol biopolymer transport system component